MLLRLSLSTGGNFDATEPPDKCYGNPAERLGERMRPIFFPHRQDKRSSEVAVQGPNHPVLGKEKP